MSIRLNAEWMTAADERLLEELAGEGWTHPRRLAASPAVYLSYRETRLRLRFLADAELVAPSDDDFDLYHITGDGERYLQGERDQELHPHPFTYGRATTRLM